jgi:delta 1-pyrroline-5-carboxylate dehydrogenase
MARRGLERDSYRDEGQDIRAVIDQLLIISQAFSSSGIQCHCPATGRLLETIKPSTADDIDRAVASAAEAQTIWKNTTFAARRKVLRTLLKSVGWMINAEPLLIWVDIFCRTRI